MAYRKYEIELMAPCGNHIIETAYSVHDARVAGAKRFDVEPEEMKLIGSKQVFRRSCRFPVYRGEVLKEDVI